MAVVIAAHNEQDNIARTVASIRQCDPVQGQCEFIVVADNCTDSTPSIAEMAGARVLVRNDEHRRGKGYAINFAFQRLLPEGFQFFVVVDADSVVDRNLLREVQSLLASGADAVQCRYQVSNVSESMRTRLMNVALLSFNVLRPSARDRLGLSAGILGNGFALRRDTVLAVPYDASSVVEDLEYHLRLVRAGKRVRFAENATVWGDMPASGTGVSTQRARWEGGRILMLKRQGHRLLRGLLHGQVRLAEPLLDLLLLPLAYHVALLGAALAIPFRPTRVYAATGLAITSTHVLTAILLGGGTWQDLLALSAAPFYVLWKLTVLRLIVRTSHESAAWVRTARANSRESLQ